MTLGDLGVVLTDCEKNLLEWFSSLSGRKRIVKWRANSKVKYEE